MRTKALIPLALLVAFALVGVGLLASSGSGPYRVKVHLLNAERMVPGNNVDLGGVPVGNITSVQLAPDSSAAGAIVTIQLNSRYAPLRTGTRAVIRPNGAVGSNFLELEGTQSGPTIPSGGSIPLQDTQVPVTLDQVSDVFNANTRQELKTMIQQGNTALAGRSGDVSHILQKLPGISSDLAATTGSLDTQTEQLGELDSEFNRVATMMAGEHTALKGDVGNGASILSTLANHQAGLQSELSHANSALGKTNDALAGRQQDTHQLLKELPGLLQTLKSLQTNATTSAGTVNPCMGNLLTMLNELASADNYKQAAGSTDGTGYMLRIDPQLAGPESGNYSPQDSCSGGGG